MPYKDPLVRKEYQQRYAVNHAEEACVRQRGWYKRNKARAQRKSKAYRLKNREKIRANHLRWLAANPANILLARAKSRAKQKHIEFNLTISDIIIPSICPVLGIPIIVNGRKTDNSPSIDRIDNRKGYVSENILVVSWRANRLKGDASFDELVALAKFYRAKKCRS